jgi:hypothetical protein
MLAIYLYGYNGKPMQRPPRIDWQAAKETSFYFIDTVIAVLLLAMQRNTISLEIRVLKLQLKGIK